MLEDSKVEVRLYENEKGFYYEEIDINTITEFGIVNKVSWNNNGTFKKWVKRGYIRTNKEFYLIWNEGVIKELKETLKGKYKSSKSSCVEYKNDAERKATDWSYKVIL